MAVSSVGSGYGSFLCCRPLLTGSKPADTDRVLPVPDPGHGRKRWYPVSGCYHPCAYGRVPYRKAEAGTGMEGNAHCLLKWSNPWRTFFHSHWLIHCGRKRKAFCIRLCCIRLYRSCVTFSNGDLRCRRYLYPTVL